MAKTAGYRAQLAQLYDEPPSGDGWVHELKLDGYRIGVVIAGAKVLLMSRRGTEFTGDFPEIVAAAKKLATRDAILDGEAVALTAAGVPSFEALQRRGRPSKGRTTIVYYAFDLLHLDGRSTARQPLEERKAILRELIGDDSNGVIRYTPHYESDGHEVLARACALGGEGIVSKRRDAPYRAGARHRDWRKIKCSLRQEFVIGGFTEPSGSRVGIGALLVGYYEDGTFRFAGKVGTGSGWTADFGQDLRKRLERIERDDPPFVPPPPPRIARAAHWVQPTIVAEIAFTEWTAAGNIRHPSLQGVRKDKKAREVVRERAHTG